MYVCMYPPLFPSIFFFLTSSLSTLFPLILSSPIPPRFSRLPLLLRLPLPLSVLFRVVEIDIAWRMRVCASVCVWRCALFYLR